MKRFVVLSSSDGVPGKALSVVLEPLLLPHPLRKPLTQASQNRTGMCGVSTAEIVAGTQVGLLADPNLLSVVHFKMYFVCLSACMAWYH